MPKTILLVEDEPLIALALEDVFGEMGFHVIAASDGAAAIEALEHNEPKIAALVTDIRLGNGPNGWHIGLRARELEPTLPVLYMSGDSGPDWPRLAVPNSEMMTKPFDMEHMAAVVSKLTMTSDATPRLQRYFFNIVAGDLIVEDFEGTDLFDIDAAREEALKDARALMSAAILHGWDISGRSIDIRGEAGNVLMNVAFSDAIVRRD